MQEPGASAPPQTEVVANAPRDPDWLSDSPFVREGLDFLRTATAFARAPRRFSAQWAEDPKQWMNPVVFVATSAALTFTTWKLLSPSGAYPAPTFRESLLQSLSPHLYYLSIALLTHGGLRLLGSKRRWTTTTAMALYAGGTFATLAMLLLMGSALVLKLGWGLRFMDLSAPARVLVGAPAFLAFIAFLGTFCSAVRALHRMSVARMALALYVALAMTGFLVQRVPLQTLRLVSEVRHAGPVPFIWLNLVF